jgi:hypothetical protein
VLQKVGECSRAAFASSTAGSDGEVSFTASGCTSDVNQFRFILADKNRLTFRCWSGLVTSCKILNTSLSIYAQFKIQSVKKVTMAYPIHYDLRVEVKEQWEGAWIQGREMVCRIAFSEMPTVAFAIFPNAY